MSINLLVAFVVITVFSALVARIAMAMRHPKEWNLPTRGFVAYLWLWFVVTTGILLVAAIGIPVLVLIIVLIAKLYAALGKIFVVIVALLAISAFLSLLIYEDYN